MVAAGSVEPARLPPPSLDALEPTWSRLVTATCEDGDRTFHVLDSAPEADPTVPTVLCVHGNPSWSYLWRRLFIADSPFRFVAIDHLDMGYSERTGTTRRLADRVSDLSALTHAMGITGQVITLAHDWGGPISVGWALANRDQLSGMILCNTAVHQPDKAAAPSIIRTTRTRGVLGRATVDTTAFITGAFEMSRPRTPQHIRKGFLAPYDRPDRRSAIKTFVEDIPLEHDHPSRETLDRIAAGLRELSDVPSLLLWGAKDPVFSDLYLHDLEARLPHADVHRWPNAGHFVTEDAPTERAVLSWLDGLGSTLPPASVTDLRPTTLLDAASEPDRSETTAIVEMTGDGASITFAEFTSRVDETAAGLLGAGIEHGDRVAVMIPPGIDLAVAVYGAWRAGAIAVLVDGALTPPQMTAALRSANPKWLVGISRALAAARALRWPGSTIAPAPLSNAQQRALGTAIDLQTLGAAHTHDPLPPLPTQSDHAAIVFTSGSTGPSKGVRYTHAQIGAQRDKMRAQYEITDADRLVAAFAPFALYGPMLGITSVVPDMDVSAPASLDAPNLATAVEAVDATMVFASPAALENIVRTAAQLPVSSKAALDHVRLLLSAGAPVRVSLLQAMRDVTANAVAHTPYGMTECLPVASISLPELEAIGTGDGVCVGRPLPGVEVQIEPIDGSDGLGEILVRADHMRTDYDRLWFTTRQAGRPDSSWHATGDIGRLDAAGLLWVSGRAAHMIATDSPSGTVGLGPVGIEKVVEQVDGVYMAAAVGIDGVETTGQKLAVVVQLDSPSKSPVHADLTVTDAARAAVTEWQSTVADRHGTTHDIDVVAVLSVPKLPVDRRHNSKIDRTKVAEWANRVLAGGSVKGL